MGLDGERKCVRQMGILSGGDAVVRVFGSAWMFPVCSHFHLSQSHLLIFHIFSGISKFTFL